MAQADIPERVQPQKRQAIRFAAVVVVLAALFALAYFLDAAAYLKIALDWIRDLGTIAPIVFIALYIVVTVLFVPGSILTLGAGAVFGVLWGTVVVSVGSTLGATAAFLVGRYFMRDWVHAKVSQNEKFSAVDDAIGAEGAKIVFLLRLSPVFPYNLSNYVFSLTKIGVLRYMIASWVGMLPGTVMYVYIGSLINTLAQLGTEGRARTTGEWILYGVGLVATVVVTVFVTRTARNAIRSRVGAVSGPEKESDPGAGAGNETKPQES